MWMQSHYRYSATGNVEFCQGLGQNRPDPAGAHGLHCLTKGVWLAKTGTGASSDNDNRDPEIVSVLIRISKKTRTILGLRLAEIGLATGEDDLMLALQADRTATVETLSSDLGVRIPTIRRAVDRLAGRGLMDQITGSIIRLTEQGIAMQPKIIAVHKRMAADILRTIDVERLAKLTAELNELDSSLSVSLTKMT